MMRNLLILVFLLLATPAWANPPATCVRTFYIDWDTGNDANAGTSGSPWKRHPFMNGETVTYTHAAGDCFVFKGGVTWPNAAFPLHIKAGGTLSNPDYLGVDSTWYTGGAWSRPIFDMEDANVTGADGDHKPVKISGTSSSATIIIDNLDVRRQQVAASGFANFASIAVESGTVTVKNCWVHDWGFAAGRTADGKWGGIQYDVGTLGVIEYNEIGPAKNGNNGFGAGAPEVRFNIFHDIPNFIIASNCNIHDNIFYDIRASFDLDTHGNMAECLNGGTRFYNNVVHGDAAGVPAVVLLMVPEGGKTDYYYNNVFYNVPSAIPLQIYTNGISPGTATVNIFNNTFECGVGDCVRILGPASLGTLFTQNNHYITTVSGNPVCTSIKDPGNCAVVTTWTDSNNVTQTQTAATAQGYTSATSPAYKPTDVTDATVNIGTNVSASCSGCAFDYLGTARPQGSAYDAGWVEFIESGSPATSYNPTSLTFAEMPVGHGTATQTITLTNVGSTDLTVSSVAASGTNAADFHVTSTCVSASPIAASDTCTITIYFNPQAAGSRSGSVTVTSDAASSPDVLTLSGTAVTKSSIALVGVPQ